MSLELTTTVFSIEDGGVPAVDQRTTNLKYLSDEQLLTNTKNLVTRERELLLEVLQHLREVDSRRLYLEIGYPSLWAYCTQELKYSEAAAQRRIEAMRALRELPMIAAKIESGELSISNIAKAQSTMRRVAAQFEKSNNFENKSGSQGDKHQRGIQQSGSGKKDWKDVPTEPATISKLELFKQLENKSQKQAEQILATVFPEAAVPQEKVRAIDGEISEVRFTARRELLAKLERVRNLMSHKNPNASMAELVEMMADFVIAKKDLNVANKKSAVPKKDSIVVKKDFSDGGVKRETGRADTNAIAIVATQALFNATPPPQRRLEKIASENQTLKTKMGSRATTKSRPYITIKLRREVWSHAKGCCEFTDEQSGRRCETRHQLEIEHKMPRAFGGKDHRENLALYCRAHNQMRARQALLM